MNKKKIDFAVNYIFPDVMDLKSADEIMVKYPGGKWDIDTLNSLLNNGYKLILHGIIPSSGSILDTHLCDSIDEFAEVFKKANQRWLSFHLDYKDKYEIADNDETFQKNIKILGKFFPKMPILLENMLPVDTIERKWSYPDIFSLWCEKYNCGVLLDIPHAVISAKHLGITPQEYMDRLPLGKVKEIHVAGWNELPNGDLYDGHTMCTQESYDLLKYALERCDVLEVVSLEYSPARDYDGETIAKEYREKRTTQDLFDEQQIQIAKIQEIVSEYYQI